MAHFESMYQPLYAEILSILTAAPTPLTTRSICNRVLGGIGQQGRAGLKITNIKFIYIRLRQLRKDGKVIVVRRGFWAVKNSKP